MADLPLEISVTDAARAMSAEDAPLLLDCRAPDEHATSRIAGAILIPMQDLPARIGELAGHEPRRIIVHCHHGMRSLRVATWLRERGFGSAQSMAGGIDAWSDGVDPSVPRY
ncbi:MAG: rhodanese [Planctomycetes bacterium]|nr:rhodanese [Planctomycetota bacterium]